SSRRRHTTSKRDWSSDVCSSDLTPEEAESHQDAKTHGIGEMSATREARDDVPEPPKVQRARSGISVAGALRVLLTVIGVVGVLGSLILASGALCAAIGVDFTGTFTAGLAAGCDTLAAPLQSAFSFTGDNAEQKQHLVVWGTRSLGYLIIGSFAQSVGRRR